MVDLHAGMCWSLLRTCRDHWDRYVSSQQQSRDQQAPDRRVGVNVGLENPTNMGVGALRVPDDDHAAPVVVVIEVVVPGALPRLPTPRSGHLLSPERGS